MSHLYAVLQSSIVYNTICNKASFPSTLKEGRIIPHHSDGSKQDVKNYRPITLLNSVSKVFGKLIIDKVTPLHEPVSDLRITERFHEKQLCYHT